MVQRVVKISIMLLIMASIVVVASAQDPSSNPPTVIYQAAYPDLQMTFTEVQLVIDFEPGAGFPLHHHGGPTLALVLEGEITLEQDGTEMVYRAGESWTETPSEIHTAFNASDRPARVLATFLLPPGAEALTPEQDAEIPAIAPAFIYQAVFPDITMDGMFSENQAVLEFNPGAGIPLHVHGGPTLALVLDGEITLRANGEERVYKAGESWTEMPGDVHEAFNSGDTPAHVVATFLLPPGAEATTVQGS
jgi:quercetin dioxygenase-like cupin family protein